MSSTFGARKMCMREWEENEWKKEVGDSNAYDTQLRLGQFWQAEEWEHRNRSLCCGCTHSHSPWRTHTHSTAESELLEYHFDVDNICTTNSSHIFLNDGACNIFHEIHKHVEWSIRIFV